MIIITFLSRDNDLCIDFSGVLGFSHQFIMRDWQHGMAWSLCIEGEVETSQWYESPDLPITMPNIEQSAWLQTIPQPAQQILYDLDAVSRPLVFPCLSLMARYRSVYELFCSAPLLASLLLNYAIQHEITETNAAVLFAQKRTLIMGTLGFPACKSAIKVLGKVRYQAFDAAFLSHIKNIFRHEHWQQLTHYPQLEMYIIQCLNRQPQLMGSPLLGFCEHAGTAKFLSDHYDVNISHSKLFFQYFTRQASLVELIELRNLMQDTLNMIGNDSKRCKAVLRMRDEMALLHLHDALVDTLPDRDGLRYEGTFPDPPIAGNQYIQPITDGLQLREEGQQQRHCVSCYARRIVSGTYYVYQMLNPERTTIGLALNPLGRWHIDQLQLKRNQKPSQATQNRVEAWFYGDAYQKG